MAQPINELPIPPKSIQHKQNRSVPQAQSVELIDLARPRLNYVSLDLENAPGGQRIVRTHQATQYSQIAPASCSPPPQQQQREHINLQSHTPEKQYARELANGANHIEHSYREQYELPVNRLPFMEMSASGRPNINASFHPRALESPDKISNRIDIDPALLSEMSNLELHESNMLHNSQFSYALQQRSPIERHLDHTQMYSPSPLQDTMPGPSNHAIHGNDYPGEFNQRNILGHEHPDYVNLNHSKGPIKKKIHKLSPEKFDYLMGNRSACVATNSDQFDGNSNELLSDGGGGAHALPVDTVDQIHLAHDFEKNERIKTMQQLGVPPEEIIEIDRRLTQEEKDEVS